MEKLKGHLKNLSEKNQQMKELSSFLGETIRENKKTGVLVLGALLGMSALSSAQPVVLQYLTNAASGVITTGAMTGTVVVLAVGTGVLEAGSNYIRRLSDVTTSWFIERFGNKLIQKNMKTILKMPKLAQKEKSTSYLAEVLNRATNRGRYTLQSAAWGLINGGSFVLSAGILLATAPLIGGALIGLTGVKAWASHRLNQKFKKAQQAVAKKQGRNAARVRDVLEKAAFVRANNHENAEIEKMADLYQNAQKRTEKLQGKRLRFEAVMKAVDLVGVLAITLPAIYTAMKTGDLGTYFLLTGSAYRVLYGGSAAVTSYASAQDNFLSYQESMKEFEYDKSLEPKSGEKILDNCQGNITFRDVSFTYPDQEKPLLNGVNLAASKGERVVIVGKTGCGKTTLVNLLKHEMELTGGAVEVDGVDIREVESENLNNQISFVEQKPEFLKRSILENLRYAKKNASMQEIEECMKKAGLHDEIISRSEGYEALPNTLSGGQQQRLAIAQAFLKEAPIVIMDEPTSALDRYTAREVLDTILAFGKDKTLLLISHNPAEIAKADRALLLADGKIVEEGAPKDLIAERGYFYGLYREELEVFHAGEKQAQETDTAALARQKALNERAFQK